MCGPFGTFPGVLLKIPCKLDSRKLTIGKLSDDIIPAIENISKKHGVVTSRSIFLYWFYIIIDALKSSLAGQCQGQIPRMESIRCEVQKLKTRSQSCFTRQGARDGGYPTKYNMYLYLIDRASQPILHALCHVFLIEDQHYSNHPDFSSLSPLSYSANSMSRNGRVYGAAASTCIRSGIRSAVRIDSLFVS